MKNKLKTTISLLLSIAIILGVSIHAGLRFMPLRTNFGATWNSYLEEPKDSVDVLIIGSSVAYCDVIPEEFQAYSSLSAYNMCGPELSAPLSYYYLAEALKTQSPSTVLVEATSFFFPRYTDDAKVAIGYMPYGLNRLKASFEGAPKSERLGLIFPLYNYHSQWEHTNPITLISKRADQVCDPYRGYTGLTDARPQTERGPRDYSAGEADFAGNFEYANKIAQLCESQAINLIFFIGPQAMYPGSELVSQLQEALDGQSCQLINFNEDQLYSQIGLDSGSDYYDFMHLNYSGAVKFSRYLSSLDLLSAK